MAIRAAPNLMAQAVQMESVARHRYAVCFCHIIAIEAKEYLGVLWNGPGLLFRSRLPIQIRQM